MQVRSLGWENPLRKEKAAHSSILTWEKNPMDRGPSGATVHGIAKGSHATEHACVHARSHTHPLTHTPLHIPPHTPSHTPSHKHSHTHTFPHTHTHTHTHTMEYYLAMKKNKIMPFTVALMDLEIIILSEVSQTKTNILQYHLYLESKH